MWKRREACIVYCLHNRIDETTTQVLKEDGKKPETKSYMWVYRSGNDGRKPIVIYDYKPSRDGDIPAEFLKDYKGYIHTDGYAGYNKVKNVTDADAVL